jgi:hypothetical protein
MSGLDVRNKFRVGVIGGSRPSAAFARLAFIALTAAKGILEP